MIAESITELIGNTPLLRIDPAVHGLRNVNLYAKLEHLNPFGSLKDRAAWGMVRSSLGDMARKGQQLLESSSGNTAKALQVLASIHGLQLTCVTNRIRVPETKGVLKLLGAEIEELPGRADCHDPNDPDDPLVYIQRKVEELGETVFVPNQYFNEDNPGIHRETTAEEILSDLGSVDVLIGSVGTSGSTRGTAERLREANPEMLLFGIGAERGDFIPGIRNEEELWEVGLFERSRYDDLRFVSSADAIDGMLTLIRRCGVLGGPTSGAAFAGGVQSLKEVVAKHDRPLEAVFIVCDRAEWYLSYIRERRPELFGEPRREQSFRALAPKLEDTGRSLPLDEAKERVERGDTVVIDIRSPAAFRASHVPRSINVPESTFAALVDGAQPFAKGTSVIIVCPVGKESRKFAGYLGARGYEAFSMEGGIIGWRDAGYMLERHPRG